MTLSWQFANTPSQCLVYSGIIVEAMRESWSDDRLDDLSRHVETGFTRVHEGMAALRIDNRELRRDMATLDRDLRAEIGLLATREELHTEISAVRSEMGSLRSETREGFEALNHRFGSLQRTLIAGILAGFIGLLVTHFG